MDQDTAHREHARLGIVRPAADHQVIGLRDIVHHTTATCRVMEPDSGGDMQHITGAGTTMLTTGGSGQLLQR